MSHPRFEPCTADTWPDRTTIGMLGGSTQLLYQHPDQCELLVDDPTLIQEAIEALLRMTSPVQGLCRTVIHDVTMSGTTIPAGRRVLPL